MYPRLDSQPSCFHVLSSRIVRYTITPIGLDCGDWAMLEWLLLYVIQTCGAFVGSDMFLCTKSHLMVVPF